MLCIFIYNQTLTANRRIALGHLFQKWAQCLKTGGLDVQMGGGILNDDVRRRLLDDCDIDATISKRSDILGHIMNGVTYIVRVSKCTPTQNAPSSA